MELVRKTEIDGVLIISPRRFEDDRGFFSETYNARALAAGGLDQSFVQDNHSLSVASHTVRGLHYQAPPMAQAKLVRVSRGAVIDVAVDIRVGSPTYGRHVKETLSAANGRQLYVPVGFLHGFITLEPETEVQYKVSDFYSGEHDGAVLWNSPQLGIDWGVDADAAVLSAKDAGATPFSDFASPFQYD
ncbi:MAG: dTDP-4-dehydrorhamnose 3,5-epimerase [Pseudomonadota bacterium]